MVRLNRDPGRPVWEVSNACVRTSSPQGDEETALRQCYDGVERDGEVVRVRDTVLLRSGPRKKSLPYVAKISALWEDPKTGRREDRRTDVMSGDTIDGGVDGRTDVIGGDTIDGGVDGWTRSGIDDGEADGRML